MNQGTFLVSLINLKEKTFKLYEKGEKVLRPLFKALLAYVVLVVTARMFPYQTVKNLELFLIIPAVIQAFLPISFLYYIASALILFELWKVSFDIFAAFVLIILICAVGYFRIDSHYSFIAAIVPILFFLKLGIAVPVALAVAFGMEALFPAMAGVVVYYFSLSIVNAGAVLGDESASVGIGLQHVLSSMLLDKTFLVMALSVCVSMIITCLLRRAFYDKAWLVAGTLGNTVMALLVLAGCVYCNLDIQVWYVIFSAVLGMILCLVVEFFRGIGDVSRVEKTVFEDDEYIYYVKAVPKIRVAQSEPNVIILNESLHEESEQEEPEQDEPEQKEPEQEGSGAASGTPDTRPENSAEKTEPAGEEKETEKEKDKDTDKETNDEAAAVTGTDEAVSDAEDEEPAVREDSGLNAENGEGLDESADDPEII